MPSLHALTHRGTDPVGFLSRSLPKILVAAAMMALTASTLPAQAAGAAKDDVAPAKTKKKIKVEETVVVMSPFEVSTAKDTGYTASSSLAGTRLNAELRDIAAPVQVITPEFMNDIGATNLEKLLVYTTNTEIAGIGGNFYGGDTWSSGYMERMLTEPQTATRIRGLNEADITRDYFPSDIPMDWYNMSRVDISRGPNSILFGLGSPAGLINNTLKVPNMSRNADSVELQVGSYGSFRQVVDVDQMIIPHQLSLRVVGLNGMAHFQQDFTFNHDKRLYAAGRWQPRLADHVYTQLDVQAESGRISANRPEAGTPADFISNWFGPLNRLTVPNDQYWDALGSTENVLTSQTLGGQWWSGDPATFFSNPNSGAAGIPGGLQAMMLRGGTNILGGGWGSWAGVLNPNWGIDNSSHFKNQKSYYANNPAALAIINAYEAQTGKAFSGFGSALWPTQAIVSGPLAITNQTLAGPNKSEWNNFDTVNVGFTQSYLDGRIGVNVAYDRQTYRDGYTNLVTPPWGANMISVDINQELRDGLPNPNFGRPYTIGQGRGGLADKYRENWRATEFVVLKASDFLHADWLVRALGEHTLTGVESSQRYEDLNRSFALYRWNAAYEKTAFNNTYLGDWLGVHYLGPSLLNTPSMSAITGVSGIRTLQTPPQSQSVLFDNQVQGSWMQSNFGMLSWQDNPDLMYDGATQGYDDTKSKAFVWQGKMLDNIVVPIFGWRQDAYTRWDKPSTLAHDPTYGNIVQPFSPAWNYTSLTPIYAKQERRSWSVAVHGRELLELFHCPLPRGTDVTFLYNDSSSFRPSDVALNVYGQQESPPSGETRDVGVLLTAFDGRVSLRVTQYRTVQHNTVYSGGPAFNSNKAWLARAMDGMMAEIVPGLTKPQNATPEWLVNRWMFGDTYDKTLANTPLPADWRSDPNIMNEPLRIRRSAVPGSPTYVAQGAINPDTGADYTSPPIDADEVAYRTLWFKARTDAEWSRPVDKDFWGAMKFTRNYNDTWGGYWEIDAWNVPANLKNLNDLVSTGDEFELTANPTPNWRVSFNASKAQAVRSNVFNSWTKYIANMKGVWLDGATGTPSTNYWNYKGYSDIRDTSDAVNLGTDTFGNQMYRDVYAPYLIGKATEGETVGELAKWHWNGVTNYTFSHGFLKNVGIGGAVRWEDRPLLGYYPKYNSDAGAWVVDVKRPIRGPAQTYYDAWISYQRPIARGITWTIQLNGYNLFASRSLIPTVANPDGTIAQVRLPADTTWQLRNTFSF